MRYRRINPQTIHPDVLHCSDYTPENGDTFKDLPDNRSTSLRQQKGNLDILPNQQTIFAVQIMLFFCS